MLTINKDTVVRSMSAAHPAVARAASGDEVRFFTMDAMGDQYLGQTDFIINEDMGNNPATGPLYVEGAAPGDTLKVTILDIKSLEMASMTIAPGFGVFGEDIPELYRQVFKMEDGTLQFNDRLRLKMRPMLGVIGVAPAEGEVDNSCPGPHGGNMDNKRIEIGAAVYLPVYHSGALLSLGDVHALMGDGEASICGAEVRAEVIVRVEIIKRGYETIMVVGHGRAMTVCSADTLGKASFQAAQAMRRFLAKELGMSLFESASILSLIGDMRICEVVDPLMCCRMEVPMSLFEAYGYRFD